MANFGICLDISEAIDLFTPHGLYLKPIAKLNISVQLPIMKNPGQSISNWEVMEKLKKMIKPDQFIFLKVAKSTLEFVRFEGEVENKGKLKVHLGQLDGKFIKLSGFTEALKVRAAEAKIASPTRHDWDAFFRDAKNMNEQKFGERPDTIHVRDLPCRWFASKKDKDLPNEFIVRKVFETFGEINCMDIPILDPYRKEMMSSKGSIQTFSSFGQDFLFEVFVQYKEYMSFVKAMNSLRGMKLLFKEGETKALTAMFRVEFDKSKHLSEKAIKKRNLEREKLIRLEKEREERVMKEREDELRRKEEDKQRLEAEERERELKREEKLRKREQEKLEREKRRKEEYLESKRRKEEEEMQKKIALEERKILIAHRKLETIRLLSELFGRIKVKKQQQLLADKERRIEEARCIELERRALQKIEEEKIKIAREQRKKEQLDKEEREIRERIVRNLRLLEIKKKNEEKRRDDTIKNQEKQQYQEEVFVNEKYREELIKRQHFARFGFGVGVRLLRPGPSLVPRLKSAVVLKK